MNSNYVQCKIKVSETWTDCAVGLATVADGSKARNIRHRLGSRRLVICASLSTGNGLASSTRRAVMIYVIRQTRRCCCNFLPLPLHLLCCRSTSPIDKCATFCAIKEKIFRAINHQRRRSWKRRREEPGAESKNSFVPSRSRERERERAFNKGDDDDEDAVGCRSCFWQKSLSVWPFSQRQPKSILKRNKGFALALSPGPMHHHPPVGRLSRERERERE